MSDLAAEYARSNFTVDEANEHNAAAWLAMTDDELVRCSASLGLPPELHPIESECPEAAGVLPTKKQRAELRAAADKVAEEHTSAEFVKSWIKKNRD